MGTITHFSHDHPLKFQPTHPGSGSICRLCDEYIEEDECYRCILGVYCPEDKCYLHSSCAKFTQKIKHPFHPDHSLEYMEEVGPSSRWPRCCACGMSAYGKCRYFCMDCDYALHLECAALTPFVELPEQKLPEAAFLECVKTPWDHFQYDCGICGEDIQDDDSICVSRKRPSLMHKICARLPIEIKHPFHLHPLKQIVSGYRSIESIMPHKCVACGEVLTRLCTVYNCFDCRFTLDVHCAFLMPIPQTLVLGEQEHDSAQQLISHHHHHPHPLIECHGMKSFRRRCFGCDQPFDQGSSSIHVCLECSILLDTPCINSPLEICHPLHPQHCLILGKGYLPMQGCYLCGKGNATYFYSCKDCNRFSIDICCSTKKIDFVNSEIHEHNLVYIDFVIGRQPCGICEFWCYNFVFRCLECDFCIHDHCHPSLPQTVKHECHCDSLALTRSPIRDYPDIEEEAEVVEELYCFACEKRRELRDPTYYCAECHFIAHVHCVISEIIPYLQAQSRSLPENERSEKKVETYSDMTSHSRNHEDESQSQELDDDVALLQEEVVELATEISRLTSKIDRLKQRHSQSVASLENKLLKKRNDNNTQAQHENRQ